MKFIAAVAALAGVAYAQDACLTQAAAIPPCALGYLVQGASSIAGCGLVDFQCQCSASNDIQNAIVQTVLSACGAQSAGDVIQSVSALCSCASANPGQQVSLNSVQQACSASAVAIPACALGYLASAGGSINSCAVDDFACQCSVSSQIQVAIASDVAQQCTAGIGDVINSANALCSCVSANGGGGSGGSGTTPVETTGAGTTPTATGGDTTAAPTGSAPNGGSGGAATTSLSRFTGAAASAIPAVGGIFGAVIGLLAYL